MLARGSCLRSPLKQIGMKTQNQQEDTEFLPQYSKLSFPVHYQYFCSLCSKEGQIEVAHRKRAHRQPNKMRAHKSPIRQRENLQEGIRFKPNFFNASSKGCLPICVCSKGCLPICVCVEKCALIIRDGARTKESEEGEEGLHVKKVCRVNTDFPKNKSS